jgi:hypothetical protein
MKDDTRVRPKNVLHYVLRFPVSFLCVFRHMQFVAGCIVYMHRYLLTDCLFKCLARAVTMQPYAKETSSCVSRCRGYCAPRRRVRLV